MSAEMMATLATIQTITNARALLAQIATPILIVLGNIGEILNIIIFSQRNFRKNACAIYFLVASCTRLFFINFTILLNGLTFGKLSNIWTLIWISFLYLSRLWYRSSTKIVEFLQDQILFIFDYIHHPAMFDRFSLYWSLHIELLQCKCTCMESTTHCLQFDRCCINLLDTVFRSCFSWLNNSYSIWSTILYRGRRILFILCGCIYNCLHLFIATYSDDYLWSLNRSERSTSTKTCSTSRRQRLRTKKRSTSLAHVTLSSVNHCHLHHSTWSVSGKQCFKLVLSLPGNTFGYSVDVFSSDNQLAEKYCLANVGCVLCQLSTDNVLCSLL